MKSTQFKACLYNYFEKAKGTYLYDLSLGDHECKLSNPNEYEAWFRKLFPYLISKYQLKSKNILDVGCATGEFTVWMNILGYNAKGVDVHSQFIDFAKVLAKENGFGEDVFIKTEGKRLPFPDKSIDIVTLFSVLEHIDDDILKSILPEIHRVCRGVVYILVPNKLKQADDHTGMWFVPFMPRAVAALYIKLRGKRYRYFISESGAWDVYYRTLNKIEKLAKPYFSMQFPDDEYIYPSLEEIYPFIGKHVHLFSKKISMGLRIPVKLIYKIFGIKPNYFYPYLNFILMPKDKDLL